MISKVMLPKNTLKRLAKVECGVKRVSDRACELLCQYSEEYAIRLIQKANELSNHANRTTILDRDIEQAKKEV